MQLCSTNCFEHNCYNHHEQVPELAASMGLSTAPQLRFLKRQGRGAKSAAADEQKQDTQALPAAGVLAAAWPHRLAWVEAHDSGSKWQWPAAAQSSTWQQQPVHGHGHALALLERVCSIILHDRPDMGYNTAGHPPVAMCADLPHQNPLIRAAY